MKEVIQSVERLVGDWDPLGAGYHRVVLICAYIPFLFVTLAVLIVTYVRIIMGSLTIEPAITIFAGLILFFATGVQIVLKNDVSASFLLTLGIIILGLVSMYMWGLIHPIGFLLCLLGIRVSYILLGERFAGIISATTFLLITLIGLLHLSSFVKYDYNWVPRLTVFDFIVIIILTFLFVLITWINATGLRRNALRITKMEGLLRSKNIHLQKRVIEKTREAISTNLQLSRSYKTLQSAYSLLESSEMDRFTKMNLLAHYGLILSGVVHEMANPLMLIMTRLEQSHFPKKGEVMHAIEELASTVAAVRSNIRVSDVPLGKSIRECLTQAVIVLKWRFEKEGVSFFNDAIKANRVIKSNTDKFGQIILNLLNNAVEEAATARVKKVRMSYQENGGYGHIYVKNSGKKIQEKNVRKIFDMFYSTKEAGSGIGLFISREYARNYFFGDIKLVKNTGNEIAFEFKFKLFK